MQFKNKCLQLIFLNYTVIKRRNIMTLLYLIKEFVIISCFAIGGGMVAIPFIQNIADTTGLITEENIVEMIAISEITPGPLIVNMATYIGYIVEGPLGGILTTLALIIPQILIVYLVFRMLNKFKDSKNMMLILKSLRPITLALTVGAGMFIFKPAFLKLEEFSNTNNIVNIFNLPSILCAIVLTIMIRKIKIHPIFFLIFGAFLGVIFHLT